MQIDGQRTDRLIFDRIVIVDIQMKNIFSLTMVTEQTINAERERERRILQNEGFIPLRVVGVVLGRRSLLVVQPISQIDLHVSIAL